MCYFTVVPGTGRVILSSVLSLSFGPTSSETKNVYGPWRRVEGKEVFLPAALVEQESRVCNSAFICGRFRYSERKNDLLENGKQVAAEALRV